MIHPPRRSVTRFFIPLIDVLILLFCIFLLMPFVSAPPAAEPEKTAPELPPVSTDLTELKRQLAEAKLRLDRVQKERASVADRMSVRVLEIDKGTGGLFYFDPDRQEVKTASDARRLIDRQRRQAGAKDLFFLILYPRELSGFPLQSQVDTYRQWFHDVPVGFDNPLSGS